MADRVITNQYLLAGSVSNYMTEVRPGTYHGKRQIGVAQSNTRGPIAGERGRPVLLDSNEANKTVSEALELTNAVSEGSYPVHIKDLKAVADAHTKELLDREYEVRTASSRVLVL